MNRVARERLASQRSHVQHADDRASLVWPGAALAAALLAGCSCSAGAVVDAAAGGPDGAATVPDAPFPDAPPGPELCADGVRRVDVELPPIASPDGTFLGSAAVVVGDEILAARVGEPALAQFARVGLGDGALRAVGSGPLPQPVDIAQAFRPLGGGATEVLFTATDVSTTAVVATFAADGLLAGTRSVLAPPGPAVQQVVGATPTATGFVMLARSTQAGGANPVATLVNVVDHEMRLQALETPWPSGLQGARAQLSAADGNVWYAIGGDLAGGVQGETVVGQFDSSTTPYVTTSARVSLLVGTSPGTVRLIALDDGTAVLAISTGIAEHTLALAWIDAELHVLGQWAYPIEDDAPILDKAAGELADHSLVLRVRDEVRVARVFGPGMVAGGRRPLLDGVTQEVAYLGPHDAFARDGVGYALAVWAPDLSIVTFCGAP